LVAECRTTTTPSDHDEDRAAAATWRQEQLVEISRQLALRFGLSGVSKDTFAQTVERYG
jgi:hypothetical protein